MGLIIIALTLPLLAIGFVVMIALETWVEVKEIEAKNNCKCGKKK